MNISTNSSLTWSATNSMQGVSGNCESSGVSSSSSEEYSTQSSSSSHIQAEANQDISANAKKASRCEWTWEELNKVINIAQEFWLFDHAYALRAAKKALEDLPLFFGNKTVSQIQSKITVESYLLVTNERERIILRLKESGLTNDLIATQLNEKTIQSLKESGHTDDQIAKKLVSAEGIKEEWRSAKEQIDLYLRKNPKKIQQRQAWSGLESYRLNKFAKKLKDTDHLTVENISQFFAEKFAKPPEKKQKRPLHEIFPGRPLHKIVSGVKAAFKNLKTKTSRKSTSKSAKTTLTKPVQASISKTPMAVWTAEEVNKLLNIFDKSHNRDEAVAAAATKLKKTEDQIKSKLKVLKPQLSTTKTEKQILDLKAQGLKDEQIADQLSSEQKKISSTEVKELWQSIKKKINPIKATNKQAWSPLELHRLKSYTKKHSNKTVFKADELTEEFIAKFPGRKVQKIVSGLNVQVSPGNQKRKRSKAYDGSKSAAISAGKKPMPEHEDESTFTPPASPLPNKIQKTSHTQEIGEDRFSVTPELERDPHVVFASELLILLRDTLS